MVATECLVPRSSSPRGRVSSLPLRFECSSPTLKEFSSHTLLFTTSALLHFLLRCLPRWLFPAQSLLFAFKSLRNVERFRMYFSEHGAAHYIVFQMHCKHGLSL